MHGDQEGGTSPYPNLSYWPDGDVDSMDVSFVGIHFGESEGAPTWEYMADCVPDRVIDSMDIAQPSRNFGQSGGSYSSDLTGIHVVFSPGGEDRTPNAQGYVSIPAGATSFTVYRNSTTIMALVTFYTEELVVAVSPRRRLLGVGR